MAQAAGKWAVGAVSAVLLAGGGYWLAKATIPSPRSASASLTSASVVAQGSAPTQTANAPQSQPAELSPDVLFSKFSPTVVRVVARTGDFRTTLGSGFFVTRTGLLVTNHHVIRNAEFVSIVRDDNTTFFVEGVVADDPDADLAVLKVNTPEPVPFVRLSSQPSPKVGTKVFAIGNPEGLTNTLSEGLISGMRDGIKGVTILQTSAPISHGSSGGPLMTADGTVVGVTTAMLTGGQNLNFAVPASQVRKVMNRLGDLKKFATAGMAPLDPSDTQAFSPVWAALDQRQYGTASRLLVSMRSSQDTNPLYWFASGFLHGQLNNFDLAIEAYKTALDLKPDLEPGWYNLGVIYQRAKRYQDAIEAFRTASKVKPQNVRAYCGAGFVYNQLGDTNKALSFFHKAAELNPEDPVAHGGMGLIYIRQKKYDAAISECQKAIALKPDYAFAYLDLGSAYAYTHRDAEARAAWQNAIRFDAAGPLGPAGRVAAMFLQTPAHK